MRLFELFARAGIPGEALTPTREASGEIIVTGLTLDSSKVRSGYVFAALPGRKAHGAMFAESAVTSGAVAVVTDPRGLQIMGDIYVPTWVVDDPRAVMAALACEFWNHPADSMTMIGITGTNGKTSVTHLVQAALTTSGKSCGIIGTLGAGLPGHGETTHPRTTPESSELQQTLDWMRRHGADVVAMEVSSIALRERRVDGITFDVAAFTGLTQDHLDYHGTMDAYFAAKAELFTRAHRGVVVIDDPWGRALVERSSCPVTTVSAVDRSADWFATRDGDRVLLSGPEQVEVRLPIPTDFAMTNLALGVAICQLLGVSADAAARAAADARIPGRMELVASIEGVDFIVDYAHTPDAIRRVVSSAASIRRGIGGRVIVVLGAGGDRDSSKREAMGEAAAQDSDVVYVTDDNPRSEDPAAIRAAVLTGAGRSSAAVIEVPSRREAIRSAVDQAQRGDVVLVLGKGHEATQELGDHVLAFDDRLVLASFVQSRFGGGEEGEKL